MKVNDIINEGPLDFVKRLGAGIQSAVKAVQANRSQSGALKLYKQIANQRVTAWNQHLAAARAQKPQMTPQEVGRLLVTWADQDFKDKIIPGRSSISAPNLAVGGEAKGAFDYLYQRTMEYFSSIEVVSQLQKGYPAPKSDADIEDDKGNVYEYDIDTKTWYDAENNYATVTKPEDIQALNARYYQLKKQAGGNPPTTNESRLLKEGGNAIKTSTPVKKEDIAGVVELAKKFLPLELLNGIQTDVGSAGYKIQSGDIDIMVEAEDVVKLFKTQSSKDPVKDAKIMLKQHFEQQNIEAVVNGRNVSIGVVYTELSTNQKQVGQVDVMVIHEADLVAPWHQHGPRGMYDDPNFKGNELFMLISSIAKHLNLKFDAFGARLVNRDTGDVVGRTRKQVAKILLGPKAKESDLNSVNDAVKALEKDPDREGKLAQARQDAAKGLMRLPETVQSGTAAWFRQMSEVIK